MSSNSPWQKHFSQKNRSFYYFNVKDHSSLWVVNACEEGWGRTLIDPKHPERGEKYVNILTNRVFYSEGEFKRYIESKSNQVFVRGRNLIVENPAPFLQLGRHNPHQPIERAKNGLLLMMGFQVWGVDSQRRRVEVGYRMLDLDSSRDAFSKTSKDVNEVALHYSKRQDVSVEMRSESKILHLRNLNNWIKYTLIHDRCPAQSRVLDLACGKGGDLKKWKEQHIKEYVGVDIAEGSIRDAVHRFKEINGISFPARFAVGTLGTCDLSTWLDPVIVSPSL